MGKTELSAELPNHGAWPLQEASIGIYVKCELSDTSRVIMSRGCLSSLTHL
jgi:hypothetical protein